MKPRQVVFRVFVLFTVRGPMAYSVLYTVSERLQAVESCQHSARGRVGK
jgi:hypothetical protein